MESVLGCSDHQDQVLNKNLIRSNGMSSFGVLTQTVVPSPLANWILVACLRDPAIDDVAFIGNDFVQIKELHGDGYLYDVIRKEGFGSRIRNARVLGSIAEYKNETGIFFEDQEDSMCLDSIDEKIPVNRRLPPHRLVLQLCSGDTIFLGIHVDEQGALTWISSCHRIAKCTHKLQAGIHMTLNSTSEYMALGCSEGIFTICALSPRNKLTELYDAGLPLNYVESEYQIFTYGAILKIEFLHPTSIDDGSVILLVIMALRGQMRMFFYIWENDSDLTKIRPHNPKGNLLHHQRNLPLLLIPLHIKTSFMLVYESHISVYEGMHKGNPTVADYEFSVHSPLPYFHGQNKPLWVGWTRPPRIYKYKKSRDDLYLVREDGLLVFLETDKEIDGLISADTNVGELDLSCSSAIASLSYEGYNMERHGCDMVIIGGDCCVGGNYILMARREIQLSEPFISWVPAHDFVTTCSYQDHISLHPEKNQQGLRKSFPRPDRIFTCGGRGQSGSITELRHGLEAKIGLLSEYNAEIIQSWVFHKLVDNENVKTPEIILLLSLENSSAVLRLDSDCKGTAVTELDDHSTEFDLNSRTIAAYQKDSQIVQVTEKSIIRSMKKSIHKYDANDLLTVKLENGQIGYGNKIHSATICDSFSVFTTSVKNIIYLKILVFYDSPNPIVLDNSSVTLSNAKISTLNKISSNITCLMSQQICGNWYAVVSEWNGENNTISFLPLNGGTERVLKIPCEIHQGLEMEAIISISFQNIDFEKIFVICGSRDGLIFTFKLHGFTFNIQASRYDRIGATSVFVFRDEFSIYENFVLCDSNLYALMPKLGQAKNNGHIDNFDIYRFWVVDSLEPGFQQPKICSIANQPLFQPDERARDFLLTSGSQIILASLGSMPQTVPRQISLGVTPTRIIYSDTLKVLIVAALSEGKSTLLFVDPETGQDLLQPVDQGTKMPVEFISGLGHQNERIFRLFEWIYTKNERQWNFIILSTSLGRVLIISVDGLGLIYNERNPHFQVVDEKRQLNGRTKISCYTRYKFSAPESVYSVIGYPGGLLWCAGKTLFCDALDLTDKRFKRMAEYDLPSPAANLEYEDGKIYALTLSHSLEILKLVTNEFGNIEIIRTHGDQITRPSLNNVALKLQSGDSIHLVSDKSCRVSGLVSTRNAIMDSLETVFEAQLPESILRFRSGRCRPLWDPIFNLYKMKSQNYLSFDTMYKNRNLTYSLEKPEVFGISVTGSLIHFMILDMVPWKFLRFLNNLALKSPKLFEFTYADNSTLEPFKFEGIPKNMMHINGDILKRCSKERLIEDLLCLTEGELNSYFNHHDKIPATMNNLFTRFYELLQELHHGDLKNDAKLEYYIQQAYSDLEFFLRPVI